MTEKGVNFGFGMPPVFAASSCEACTPAQIVRTLRQFYFDDFRILYKTKAKFHALLLVTFTTHLRL